MALFEKTKNLYYKLAAWLQCATPFGDLCLRLWVADAFWRSGVQKIGNWDGTLSLFENDYHVPVLPPDFAAYLGTGIELVVPWFLALGFFGRLSAGFMFVYNAICVISYPDLWPNGFWAGLFGTGFMDHKAWGIMLLVTFLYGPGKWSVDHLLTRLFPKLQPSK